ncbi:hypothetical protein [Oscillibacter sp.]|uniref:hypothetical protein n=1 Tax=Oscillibacter sp. TaxID=1945593 RepID=UPI0028965544|nr:hypothetical protein [Oscillibacter sp.]
MERFIDNILESIFGGFNLQLNIIVSLLLLMIGIIILFFLRKQAFKGKKIAGWICIVIGCLGALSGAIQLILF